MFFKDKNIENEEIKYSGFHDRLLATLIDSILLILFVLPLASTVSSLIVQPPEEMRKIVKDRETGLINDIEMQNQIADFLYSGAATNSIIAGSLIQLSVIGAVFIIFWKYKSSTPGKILLKMKILDEKTLKKPLLIQFIIRYLAYFVSLIPLCLGFLCISFDKKKQGWHDKIAGTIVISTKKNK